MRTRISNILNRKGITLVELLLAMSILVVIGGAITTFMITGTNSYTRNSNEVNMQYEAQLTSNMINDLLVDATKDVTFMVDANNDGWANVGEAVISETTIDASKKKWLRILNSDRKVESDSSSASTMVSKLEYRMDEICWDPDTQKLFYSRYKVVDTPDADGNLDGIPDTIDDSVAPIVPNELLAEHVDTFSVDLTEASDNKHMKIILHFQNKDKEFAASGNVTLRNHLSVNTNVKIASIAGTPDETSTVRDVIVTPKETILEPGGVAMLSAMVSGSGLVEQEVTWSMPSGNDPNTKILPSGKVIIGDMEDISSFTVIATSVKDPSKSGTAIVYVKRVVEVTVESSLDSIGAGDTFTLHHKVIGDGLHDDEPGNPDQAVTWQVQEGAEYITNNGAPNIFYVRKNCPVGTRITIVATSVLNKSKSGVWSVETVYREGGESDSGDESQNTGNEPRITIKNTTGEIKRGGSATFTTSISNGAGYYVTFEVKATDESGKEIGFNFYSGKQSGDTYTVTLKENYDYKKSGKIEVTAYLVENGRVKDAESKKSSIAATINPVSLKLALNKEKAYETNIEEQYVYATKSGGNKIYYELQGIIEKDIDWKMSPSGVLQIHQDSDDSYFSLSAKGLDKLGKVSAKAYIGSYFLGNILQVNVSGGNIRYLDNTYKNDPIEFFLPLPEESRVDGAPKYTVDKKLFNASTGGMYTLNQWGWTHGGQYGWNPQSFFRIENIRYTFFIYYCYNTASGEWHCVIASRQYPNVGESGYSKDINANGRITRILDTEYPNSWSAVLHYNPNTDVFWHL